MNPNAEKSRFLEEFGSDYGYPNAPKNIDEIRATEFKRLGESVYLDHAGATLYSESQMEAVFKSLTSTVYGNPHTQSNVSSSTSDIVREARQQVLSFCNASAKEYKCIFTSGATAALKLVGEAFPWSSESSFMYTMENHNSVLGMREYALAKGAATFAIDIEEAGHQDGSRSAKSVLKVSKRTVQRRSAARLPDGEPTGNAFNLFAFPSECNFSGVKFNLDLVNIVKEDPERILQGSPHCKGSWMVLIDAAKGCATEPPDLSKYKADFVVISFYKLFGYPTGLGALIVRNEAVKFLKKTYFSGGTVAASIADIDFVKRREGAEESLEDGTISFLSIASIHHGFYILNTLTTSGISRHTATLATYLRNMLVALRHENGERVCTVYGLNLEVPCTELGPTVSFNLTRSDGSWVGYHEVEKLASLSGIRLRTGCFCNPGACAKYLGLSHLDLLSNVEAGHVCWDDHDLLHGKPTGAVRVSFGYMSTFEDAWKFMSFITSSFISLPFQSNHSDLLRTVINLSSEGVDRRISRYYLRSITVYPIKSCGGFRTDSWPLSSTGLLHDREWIIKSINGDVLTQKKVPEMCYISTLIDLKLGLLFVESPRCKERLQIELRSDSSFSGRVEMDIHNRRYEVQVYGDEIDEWFSNAVGRPCTLFRGSGLAGSEKHSCSNRNKSLGMCVDAKSKLNFVNEAQLLLISEESVSDLNCRLSSKNVDKGSHRVPIQVNSMRFRPNLVITGGEPYEEDGWQSLRIGNKYFTSLGGCNRCQMINLNSQGGEVQRFNEPLATLAAYRRVKGKIFFGILLRYEDREEEEQGTGSPLQVGEEVHPIEDLL